jgi:hypothetical protein
MYERFNTILLSIIALILGTMLWRMETGGWVKPQLEIVRQIRVAERKSAEAFIRELDKETREEDINLP